MVPNFLHKQTGKIFKNIHGSATKDRIMNRIDISIILLTKIVVT